MSRKKFGILLILNICALIHDAETYFFSKPEDEDACKALQFTKITTNRRLSNVEMTRKSAEQCCKMRGMTLYSAERIDEPEHFAAKLNEQPSKNSSNLYWVSANDLMEKGKFHWQFGKPVEDGDCRAYKWDNHTWDEGQPKEKGQCVTIKANKDKILMQNANCVKDLYPFICEMQPETGGRGLTGDEMYGCSAYKFADIPGYPSLKFFEGVGNWRMASSCCQMSSWSLLDSVTAKGKFLHDAINNHSFAPDNNHGFHFIWSSGNDFKEFRQWKWSCGENADEIEWYNGEITNSTTEGPHSTAKPVVETTPPAVRRKRQDVTPAVTSPPGDAGPTPPPPYLNPDNKIGNENCLAYTDKNFEKGFEAEDYNCDEIGSIICDTNPRCSVEEQYKFGSAEPRKYDILDTYTEDIEMCSSISFKSEEATFLNVNDPSASPSVGITVYAGDKNMSWSAAMKCCQDHDMEGVTLTKAAVPIFQAVQNLTAYIATKLASGSRSTHRFWFAASSINGTNISQIKWSDGEPVDRSMLSKLRISDRIDPVCVAMGYDALSLDSLFAGWTFFDISCLDKYIPLCMKRSDNFSSTGETDQIPVAIKEAEKIAKVLRPPTEDDKQSSIIAKNRDKCPKTSEFITELKNSCPESAHDVSVIRDLGSPKNLSDMDAFKLHMQNKRMLRTTLEDAVYGYTVPAHEPRLSFKLLAVTIDIFTKMCPIVQPIFFEHAYKMFHDLHWSTSQGRLEILKVKDYKWILKLLGKCALNTKPIRARTDDCSEMMLSKDKCKNFICTKPDLETKLSQTDPVVDVMWKSFEIVHATCFPHFNESYRMFHQFSRAIVDLWSDEIMLRWKNQVGDDEFWIRVLGPDYALNLLNMERCNQATISGTYFHMRLNRNTIPDRTRLLDEKEFLKPPSS